nr:site-specific integrase [Methylotenera sp.]
MASFRKRNTGWQVRIKRKGYPEQTKTFNSYSEATTWARLIESEIDRGVFVSRSETETTTLGELLCRYSKEVTPQK